MELISDITLCSVPITPTNQIDFANTTAQTTYFSSKQIHQFFDCKYTPRTGKIKVKKYVDALNDCNYGYYTNSYGSTTKTFYFWIVQKNALNKNTTELTIQLDVFQTWLFDVDMKQCFVEREHVADDTTGLNTFPEDFELGSYVNGKKDMIYEMTGEMCYILALTDTDSSIGGVFGKTYSGFSLQVYEASEASSLSTFIMQLCNSGKGDSIAFIFTFPKAFLSANSISHSGGATIGGVSGTLNTTFTFTNTKKNFTFRLDDYTPKNNKLLCYPFNFLTLFNSSGGNVVLKFEDFENFDSQTFKIESILTQNPIFNCIPLNYRSAGAVGYIDSIQESGYGLCSWNNDNFANWYAQHQYSIDAQSTNARVSYKANNTVSGNNFNTAKDNADITAMQGLMNTTASSLSQLGAFNFAGASATALTGTVNTGLDYNKTGNSASNDLNNSRLMNSVNYENTIRSLMGSVSDASVQPNTAKGDTSACGLDVARDNVTFRFHQTMIKPEYARKIDMYFQMYGYKVNVVKVPDFKTRTAWNYIKTVGCVVGGNVPLEDRQTFANLFDNGITIWHNASYMYQWDMVNYTLN
jgi:hypothetical protein